MTARQIHIDFGVVQPSRGDSAVKIAAYCRAAAFGGFDFTRKGGEHVGGTMILPPDAPEWARDPSTLWQRATDAETRRDGQPSRIIEIELLRTIPPERRLECARAIVQPWCDDGAAAQIDIHCPVASDGGEQPHAHVILSRRALTPEGFAAGPKSSNEPWTKDRGRAMRGEIADRMNAWLAANGYESRVDHRSHAARGDDTPPEPDVSRRSIEAHKQRPDSAAAQPAAEMIAARAKRRELRATKAELAATEAEIADLRQTHDRIVPGLKSRSRRAGRREIDPAWRPAVGGDVTAVSDQHGSLRIDLASGGRIYDRGDHVVAWRAADPQAASAALAEQARRHGWTECEITGPPEWRDRIAAALAVHGIAATNHATLPPAVLEAARRHHAAGQGIAARDRFLAAGGQQTATASDSKVARASAPAARTNRTPNPAAPARRSASATTPDSATNTAPANDDRRRVQAWIGDMERQASAEYSAGRLDADELQARRLPRAATAAGDAATLAAAQRGDLEAAVRAAQTWQQEQKKRRRAAAISVPTPAIPTAPALGMAYRPSWASGPNQTQGKDKRRR